MATSTTKITSTATSPQSPPHITATTTEQSGIHYSSLYLHTVPGTIKCVCLVIFTWFVCHLWVHWAICWFFLYFLYLGFRANRIHLHTMQPVQSDGHCPVLQHGHNDRVLVHGYSTCAVSVPCGLCVQQNSMDENWVFLLCGRNTFPHADVITGCRTRCRFIHSSCGTFIIFF